MSTVPPGLLGVDISHYQRGLDFAALKALGCQFVYAKATQGVSMIDSCYEEHRQAAADNGLLFGAYHFHDPNADAAEQAAFFLSHAAPAQGDLIPMLDVETPGDSVAHNALDCAKAIKGGCGHFPVLYSGDSFFRAHLRPLWPTQATLWIARYGAAPVATCSIWQFTDALAVGEMHCDGDVYQGTADDLAAMTIS